MSMCLSKKNPATILSSLCVLISVLLFIQSCSDKTSETPGVSPVIMKVSGVSQKGPFIVGSTVTIQELNENFSPNGNTFGVATSDNLGSFDLESEIATPFVEIICTGFYYNEVAGDITDANLTLRIISPLQENLSSNLNILTTLSRKRIIHLMKEDELDYDVAKLQAEEEILNIFSISLQETTGFEKMDISQTGEANAALLAISIMLQGKNSVSDLSLLVSTIIEDVEQDGILDDQTTKENIVANARDISIPEVLGNLQNRYQELGITIEVPDFEPFISNVWQNIPPTIEIQSPIPDFTYTEGEEIIIAVMASDEDGEIKETSIFLNDTLVSETSSFSWILEDIATPQVVKVVAVDDDNASSIESVSFNTRANDPPIINITSPSEQEQVAFGSEVNITVEFSDPDGVLDEIVFYANDQIINQSFVTSDQTSMDITWTIDSTLPTQEIKIELTDNLKKTTTKARTITLRPGVRWNELGPTPFALVEHAGSDGTNFYFVEGQKVYISSDGLVIQEVLSVESGAIHLIKEQFQNKQWVIHWNSDALTSTLWNTSNGTTWNAQTTNYIAPYESFVFNDKLYAVDADNQVYELNNNEWSISSTYVSPSSDLNDITVPFIFDTFSNTVTITASSGIGAQPTNIRKMWSSTDLSTWNLIEITVPTDGASLRGRFFSSNAFWMFSNGNSNKGVFRSLDGVIWEDLSTAENIDDILYVSHQNDIYLYNGTSVYQMETFGL